MSKRYKSIRILLIEDNPDHICLIQDMLAGTQSTFRLEFFHRLSLGLDRLAGGGIDVILLDLSLPDSRGIDTFLRVRSQATSIPIIVLSALDDEAIAIKAVHEGAQDYLFKSQLNSGLLKRSICYAVERKKADKALERKRQNQSILNKILNISLMPYRLNVVLDQILEQIVKISWFELQPKGAVFLVEDKNDELVLKSSRDFSSKQKEMCSRIPFGRCLCGRAALAGKTQFADCIDDRHENRYNAMMSHGHYCIPIIASNRVLGVMVLYVEEGHRHNQEEEDFLQAITDVLAGIIERKQAEEELRKHHQHLEELVKERTDEVEQLKNRLQAENIYLQNEIKIQHNFEQIIGRSKVLKKILRNIEKVALTNTTVLILGETGTGKELFVRAIHNLSARKDRPLVKVNCAALPANLIESELFGHEKGAFTGALARKTGRFELADKGTIFLDEIGDLPLELQAKLLRILQEGEFERLGSSSSIKVDVRVIAATNRDLKKAIETGNFREDLYYRLNVFPVKCPPLRDRKEDIPALVNHFVKKYCSKIGRKIESIPLKLMESLESYHWPGNIRELENIIERAVVLTSDSTLELGELLSDYTSPRMQSEKPLTFQENERSFIISTLQESKWVINGKSGAAARLGLAPSTLRSRMKKLGIKRPH